MVTKKVMSEQRKQVISEKITLHRGGIQYRIMPHIFRVSIPTTGKTWMRGEVIWVGSDKEWKGERVSSIKVRTFTKICFCYEWKWEPRQVSVQILHIFTSLYLFFSIIMERNVLKHSFVIADLSIFYVVL